MMTITPRIRIDLHVSPVEDADGVMYYDVSDPKSGNVLRLFDFEWILAQRLDGQHNFDELVRFTEAELGFATSRADLEVYATRLQQLGFMDPPLAAGEAPRAQVQTPVATPVQQAAAPVVQTPVQPIAPPVVQTPVVQTPALAPPLVTPPVAEVRPTPEPARPIERPTPVGTGADSDDGLMGRPVITLPAQRPQAAAKAVSGPTAAKTSGKPGPEPGKSALQEALAGLPEPEGEALPPKPEVKLPESIEKGAALNMAPTALLEQVAGPSTVKTGPLETVPAPSETTPVKAPAATPAPSTTTPVKAATPPPSTTTPVKAAEPVKTPEPVKAKEPPVTTPPAVTPTKLPETTEGGGSGKWIVIALVLFAIVGAAYYFLVYLPKAHPPAIPVQVSVAKVEDVPRVFPSAAEVKKAEPQTLKLEAAGTVVSVAAENAEVTPETALVVLDVQAKLEKELADARTKIELLEKKVEVAKGKIKVDAQTKLDAQQARLGEIEASLKKVQLKPSRPGVVSKALVKAGDVVAAGADAVAVTDKALVAELKVPALEAQGLKAGMEAKLSAGPTTVTAQVVRATTEGEFTTLVFSLPADAAVKAGDKLSLQRGMLDKVVRTPAAALVEGNKVYVIRDGKAAVQQVTVADRDGDSVLLQGLSSGDSIIVSRPPELREGAAVQSAATPAK